MTKLRLQTIIDDSGDKFHIVNDIKIQCSGGTCYICNSDSDVAFEIWENSIPFPLPPKGKKYKIKRIQENRGKTIAEICYTCKEIPCYVCRRGKCPEWMKSPNTKGQEVGCGHWERGRCKAFSCEKVLIKTSWLDSIRK